MRDPHRIYNFLFAMYEIWSDDGNHESKVWGRFLYGR